MITANHKITLPFGLDATPVWGDRSPENQRACIKLLDAIRKRSNRVYVIRFNMGGPPINGKYPTRDHSRVFVSEEDAWDWMAVDTDFEWPAGAVSCSVQRVDL